MSGEKAYDRIGMQNAGCWEPVSGDSGDPIPLHGLLTAATQSKPPHAPQSLPKDTQLIDVTRDCVVLVIASHNLAEPCTDFGNGRVHAEAQLSLNGVQLGHHAFLRRFPPDGERSIAPALPAKVRETQKRKGLRLSFSTPFPILCGEPPKLDQSCFLRVQFQPELG